MKGFILGLIIVLGLIFGLVYFFMGEGTYQRTFDSEEHCELITGKQCVRSSCTFLCDYNKYGYFNGYIPEE